MVTSLGVPQSITPLYLSSPLSILFIPIGTPATTGAFPLTIPLVAPLGLLAGIVGKGAKRLRLSSSIFCCLSVLTSGAGYYWPVEAYPSYKTSFSLGLFFKKGTSLGLDFVGLNFAISSSFLYSSSLNYYIVKFFKASSLLFNQFYLIILYALIYDTGSPVSPPKY